jgi:rSAM/selenodomain-associated transferase 2
MVISIIIPTYNEEAHISHLVRHLVQSGGAGLAEILVVDAGSKDRTVVLAREAGARVLISASKGRAAQMNLGAREARGDILYFVHADTLPPATFIQDITGAVAEGFPIGCYRFKFQSENLLLKINSYCTRFNRIMCRGGDQSLFVTRSVFEQLQGYREEYLIMEEYDFIRRARRFHPFRIMPKDVLVSARKYVHNGYLRVNLANLAIFMMWFAGCSQTRMVNTYHRLIHRPHS